MDMDTTTLDTATLVTATLDTATLGSQPTPDQLLLSPELPLQLFPDQLSLLSPELLHQLSPVSQLQSFLATPALEDLEVFGKRHSLRTVTKTSKQKLNSNSIKIQNLLCCLNKLFSFLFSFDFVT